jgi:flagellar motor switch protein FliG
MGNLKQVQEDVIREVGDTVAAELAAKGTGQLRDSFDPLTTAVEVVKHLPQNDLEAMFDKLESVDEEFADELRSKMFLFDDLEKLDTRSMQRLLREVDGQLLTIALRGASDEVTEIIFASMSTRAAEMLRDDLEAMGPVRLQDVQQAQQSIVDVAFRLEAEGIIVLPRGGAVELV